MTGTQLAPFDRFNADLDIWRPEMLEILPSHISLDKFITTARVAVRNNPALLDAGPKSIREAITEAAEDGLLPDGREGVIILYKGQAQWTPMIYGVRKRAKEIANLIIDSQVVRDGDHFIWHQGDEPKIEHVPAPLGKTRGELIGVYAVFRIDGVIMHREVMDRDQVFAARNQNQGWAKSLLWTKFETEGWRKVCIRRGIKTVPCAPTLERVISRDDRNYDFGAPAKNNVTPIRRPTIDVPQAPIERGALKDITPETELADEPVPEPEPESEPIIEPEPEKKPEGLRAQFSAAIRAADKPSSLNAVWAMFEKKLKSKADRDWATEQFELRFNDLTG